MKKEYIEFINNLIESAIKEDIGDGDHSSLSTIPATSRGKMQLLVKQEGIISGIEVAKMVFSRLDTNVIFEQILNDGDSIKVGDIAFYVEGATITLLQSERIILNIMQRMSGISTETAKYVEKLKGTKTQILDTRKTAPGMRVLDKMAVKIGGGENHRMGLFDMVMLKDNHIDFAGGVKEAITKCKEYLKANNKDLKIEVEVRSIDDILKTFEAGGVDRIMLDNFTPELTKEAVKLIGGRCEIESSGGITMDTLIDYASSGIDYISVGALTHQVKSLDLSLKAIN